MAIARWDRCTSGSAIPCRCSSWCCRRALQATRCFSQGSWRALDERLDAEEVLVVDLPEAVRRQVVPLGPGARSTLAVTAAFVALLAGGVVPAAVPAAVAGILAAMALVLLGVLDTEEACRAVS